MLHSLRSYKDTAQLLMRFAYAQLIRAIDILKTAARRGQFHGRTRRKVGHGDATIAIDTYLSARRNNCLSRAQLRLEVRREAAIINVISWASLPLTTHQDGHFARESPQVPRLDGLAAQKLVEDGVKVCLALSRAGLMTLLPKALW
jgi:hypothetical protein